MEDPTVATTVIAWLNAEDRRVLRVLCRRWYFTCQWLQRDPAQPISKKSPFNLYERRFQHVWHSYVIAECRAFCESLRHYLVPPSKEETYALKMGLCQSTNTGIRPSFDVAEARSGYTLDKINRCGNLPNVLLTEMMQELRSEMFSGYGRKRWQAALYGGGPGYDAIGLAILSKFLRVQKDRHFHAVVYDNEPGWEDVVGAVAKTMDHQNLWNCSWSFQHCDITESLKATVNDSVRRDCSRTNIFVFSFVCVENFQLLQGCDFVFLRDVFAGAAVGSLFFFTDSTHRLWPIIWGVANRAGVFRLWVPHARGCHYALVMKKLPPMQDPSTFRWYAESMTRLNEFTKHLRLQEVSLNKLAHHGAAQRKNH